MEEDQDWNELSDYLNNVQLEDLAQKDEKFIKSLVGKVKERINNTNFNDTKDWFRAIINLLRLSGNFQEINKLFLEAWTIGDKERVDCFLEPNDEENINVLFKDSNGKTCLHYAADGNGDNYDVVDRLLEFDNKSDKYTRTKALFYFLSKESQQSTKVKSIYEIVKRVEKLDLSYTDEEGNNILHHIVNKADKIDDWREIIEIILDNRPDLFTMNNNINVTPETIDIERHFGIVKLMDERKKAQQAFIAKEIKEEAQIKLDQESKKQKQNKNNKKKSGGSGNKKNKEQIIGKELQEENSSSEITETKVSLKNPQQRQTK